MTPLVAYIVLFVAVGVAFIFVHLVAGKLIRPARPNYEKGTIYECGEPTIGSAWVQFDLRFYVVALLFVVFDVEVAFFFPWAEVFGKANTITNTPMPTTAAEYNDMAAKVLDLSSPHAGSPDYVRRAADNGPLGKHKKRLIGERARWEGMKQLTDEQLAAIRTFSRDQIIILQGFLGEQFEAMRGLTKEQKAMLGKEKKSLEQLLSIIEQEYTKFAKDIANLGKEDAVNRELIAQVQGQPKLVTQALKRTTLNDMVILPLENARLLSDFAQNPNETQLKKLRRSKVKALSDAVNTYEKKAQEFQKDLQNKAKEILQHLEAAGPMQAVFWGALTHEWMEMFYGFDEKQFAALGTMTSESIIAAEDSLIDKTRKAAHHLAWLAFFEVLLFFGILLVGFAYLWRRGDLAWVRSTVAERLEARKPVEKIQGQSPPMEIAGKSS